MSTESAPRTYNPKKYRILKVEYSSSDYHYEPQVRALFWWITLREWDRDDYGKIICNNFESAKAALIRHIDNKRKPKKGVVHDRHKYTG